MRVWLVRDVDSREVEELINKLKAEESNIRRIRQQLEQQLREEYWREMQGPTRVMS